MIRIDLIYIFELKTTDIRHTLLHYVSDVSHVYLFAHKYYRPDIVFFARFTISSFSVSKYLSAKNCITT